MDRIMQIHYQREISQFNLATFSHDAYNRFDSVADQAIRQLEKENEKTGEDYNTWEKLKEEDPEKWNQLKEKYERKDMDFEGMVDGMMIDVIYRTEEMIVLMEMKIIYAWKHLEIHIKKLIATAYPGTDIKPFYQWSNLVAFLKSRMIAIEGLDNYTEIIQLQQVNNKAKHTDNIHEHLQHIPEFRGEYAASYENFADFYKRVKDAPQKFLTALSKAIFQELYAFDQDKIHSMAVGLALRMNKETALKLMQELNELYQVQSGQREID